MMVDRQFVRLVDFTRNHFLHNLIKCYILLLVSPHPFFYIFSDLRYEIHIPEICEVEVRDSGLTHTIDFPRSPEFQIDLCEFESIIRAFHRLESIGLVFLRREEIAV